LRIGCDLDGCLANFTKAYAKALIEGTGKNYLPPTWETDPNFPQTWNWHWDAGYDKGLCAKIWVEVVEGKGFWQNLEPLDGAEASLKQLNRLAKQGHDVYFITHRSGVKAKQQTELWLQEYGMETPTVLLTGRKLPAAISLGLEFFIDDKLETVLEMAASYQHSVPPPHIFLKDAPYNRAGRPETLEVATSVEDALRKVGLWWDPRRGRPPIIKEIV
jgi:hypothetical protein